LIRTFAFLLFSFTLGFAQVLGDPLKLTQHIFNVTTVERVNVILSSKQSKQLTQEAKQKLHTKIYRIYLAKDATKVVGYGVLISKKVRTKTAVSLYLIDSKKNIKAIEIVAFNEPIEYLPRKKWLEVFDDKNLKDTLKLNQDIPTVTGATLSSRAITDGSRLALALVGMAGY